MLSIESMDDQDLALACAEAALEKKAENIKILDLRQQSAFADFFVICSAMSTRQVVAITESVTSRLKSRGRRAIAVEGQSEGRWVLLDFGATVMHVFLDTVRDHYDLEALWSKAGRVPIPPEYFGYTGSATGPTYGYMQR